MNVSKYFIPYTSFTPQVLMPSYDLLTISNFLTTRLHLWKGTNIQYLHTIHLAKQSKPDLLTWKSLGCSVKQAFAFLTTFKGQQHIRLSLCPRLHHWKESCDVRCPTELTSFATVSFTTHFDRGISDLSTYMADENPCN